MRTMQEAKQELLIKAMRVAYWEQNHNIPTMTEIEEMEREVYV